MTRPGVFPDDDNGRVLEQMAADGVDLASSRIVDFEHCLPNQASARAFQTAARESVLEAVLHEPNLAIGRGWEVQCRVRMIPTHAAITDAELRLGTLAGSFSGYAAGWGSMSNPDGSPSE
jgi:hypothetical protein